MTEELNAGDEIDIKALLKKVLETRYWVVASVVLVSALYWSAIALIGVTKPPVLTYQSRINLVFEGVGQSEYPNGSPFSINDIISPVVLTRVYDENDVAKFITLDAFISSFSARPYTPSRQLILRKYSDQLSNDDISVAELAELQESLNNELRKASSDGVTIIFSGVNIGEIPAQLVSKILADVPKQWAMHMVENIGVGKFEKAIYSSQVLDKHILSEMDYLIAFEMLLDRLELLQSNIAVVKDLPNGLVVRDDQSGMSLPDLEKAVLDVKRYRVAPLINPVRSLGIAKNPQLVELYFENELIELKRELEVLKAKKTNISSAYSNYVQNSSTNTSASGPNVTTQIEPEFFDKIVELTNSGADIIYRQELNTLLLTSSDKISEVEAEIVRITQILQSMKGQNSSTQLLRESYSSQVNEQMPEIVSFLSKYFDISERLYQKLSTENLGTAAQMFRMYDGEIGLSKSRTILSSKNLRTYLIICFLVALLVIPIVLIWRTLKEKD